MRDSDENYIYSIALYTPPKWAQGWLIAIRHPPRAHRGGSSKRTQQADETTAKVSTSVAHHDMGTVAIAIAAAPSGHVSLVNATLAFAWLAT